MCTHEGVKRDLEWQQKRMQYFVQMMYVIQELSMVRKVTGIVKVGKLTSRGIS